MDNAARQSAPYRTWMCVVCGFIYDEAAGLPEEGIAPGTRWEDIPETWTCPDSACPRPTSTCSRASTDPRNARGSRDAGVS